MAVQFTRTLTFTRLANTTQYTAGDAVSDNATTATVATFTLANMCSGKGGGGRIDSIVLHKSDQDLTAADFDIYLFDTAVDGANFEDNVAHGLTDAELATCLGFVALTAAADGIAMTTGDLYHKTNLDWTYGLYAGTSIYVVIIARGAYTPASAEVFTLRFSGEID